MLTRIPFRTNENTIKMKLQRRKQKKINIDRIFQHAWTISGTACTSIEHCRKKKRVDREEEFNKWETERESELCGMYSSTKEGYRIVPSTSLHSVAGVGPDTLILESASFASWTSDHVSRITSQNQIRIKVKHRRINQRKGRLPTLKTTYSAIVVLPNVRFCQSSF